MKEIQAKYTDSISFCESPTFKVGNFIRKSILSPSKRAISIEMDYAWKYLIKIASMIPLLKIIAQIIYSQGFIIAKQYSLSGENNLPIKVTLQLSSTKRG